ncbi:hypothetical protein [Candidatus Erwinia haradaeae]|uniref:Cell division protein FtsN, partial n=1 Tax=Candidatus Erwinia haradaeae TaxID=1922217 RepID=A0A803FTV0_9GAMM|nr:hypothetical protein [Candidatus Erwinia haradaeae]VFP87480.1 Cell division protein FtsN [Candidatus Erwinia haradaeae]
MIHKDYVNCERTIGLRYKNTVSFRKKRNSKILIIALSMIILIQSIFIGVFFFIIPQQSCVISTIPAHHENQISLPPKPEERWYYIQELEKKKVHIPLSIR